MAHNSEVRCGANGFRITSKGRSAETGLTGAFVSALTRIIICEIAVLNDKRLDVFGHFLDRRVQDL